MESRYLLEASIACKGIYGVENWVDPKPLKLGRAHLQVVLRGSPLLCLRE
jgi:hypothetical protein